MDSERGKLFIGGISWETTEETLREYFRSYGEVAETVIMRDRLTGRARGFGFIAFADPSVVDRLLQEKHTINGRTVELKRAMPRDEQQRNAQRSIGKVAGSAGPRTKKIFVGGLAPTVTEIDFRKYFEQFGNITDVVVMYDHQTQRPRGFGFITFDSEDAVDKVVLKSFHQLHDKMVEVKRALPKEASPGTARARSSPAGARFAAQPPTGPGGYSPYGSGYFAGGYGPAANGAAAGAGAYGAPAGYAGGAYGAGYGGPLYGPWGSAVPGAGPAPAVNAGYGYGCVDAAYAGGYGVPGTAAGGGNGYPASSGYVVDPYGGNPGVDSRLNGSSGYGAAGRQTQRVVDARFRPYPPSGDRAG